MWLRFCVAASSALAAFRWEFKQKSHPSCVCSSLHVNMLPHVKWQSSTATLQNRWILVLTHLLYLHLCNQVGLLLCIFHSQYKADLLKAFSLVFLRPDSLTEDIQPGGDCSGSLAHAGQKKKKMEKGKIIINVIQQNQKTKSKRAAVKGNCSEVYVIYVKQSDNTLFLEKYLSCTNVDHYFRYALFTNSPTMIFVQYCFLIISIVNTFSFLVIFSLLQL